MDSVIYSIDDEMSSIWSDEADWDFTDKEMAELKGAIDSAQNCIPESKFSALNASFNLQADNVKARNALLASKSLDGLIESMKNLRAAGLYLATLGVPGTPKEPFRYQERFKVEPM